MKEVLLVADSRGRRGTEGFIFGAKQGSERATKVFHPQLNNWGENSNVPTTEGEIARSKSSSLL